MNQTKKLRASHGKNITSNLDPGTILRIKHCKELNERTLNVSPSSTVIIRRAINELCNMYDEMLSEDPKKLTDTLMHEKWKLKNVCEGQHIKFLYPVAPTEAFPVFNDRIPKGVSTGEILHYVERSLKKKW